MTTSDDRRPDVEAGRADDDGGDVYEIAARALALHGSIEPDPVSPWLREREINSWAQSPSLRAAIDAGIAHERGRRIVERSRTIAAEAERDQARAQLAEVTRERDEARADLADANRYIAELEAEDEPHAKLVTYVDANGCRLAHGGHHDDDEAIEMARQYWQLAVEDGETGAACLAALDAGEVVVTRETHEPVTDDGAEP